MPGQSNQSSSSGPETLLPERDWVEIPTAHVRRVIVEFLRQLFSYSPNQALKWHDDPEKSTISIRGSMPEVVSEFAKKPTIVVQTTGAQFLHLTIDSLEREDYRTGEKIYSDLMSTTVMIIVVAATDIYAEWIATIVAKHIWLLKDILRARGFHDIGRGIQISPPTPIGQLVQDAKSSFRMVTIALPVYFQHRYKVRPAYQKVDKIDVSINDEDILWSRTTISEE